MDSNYFGELKAGKCDFGVAIYPPVEVREMAKGILGQIMTKINVLNGLDDAHLPHITIFQGGFPKDPSNDLEMLSKQLEVDGFSLEMKQKLSISAIGNIFWDVELSEQLMKIHLDALEKFRPITAGNLMKQFVDRMNGSIGLDENAKKRILTNGFPLSGQSFQPHITLGRLTAIADGEKIKDIIIPKVSFAVANIIGGPLGYAGNIEKISFDVGNIARKNLTSTQCCAGRWI